jgi:cell division septation protein DedD
MPTKEIDVYKEWLKITETARPLNHYQLLRLKQFEDDGGKVREHYRKMNAHVRKYAAGEYGPLSQKLLNELAKAMLCLTDARRKAEYDASLGRTEAASGKRQSFEQMLLARKIVDQNQLNKARSFANTVGLEVRDALVQQKAAPADTVMATYAESIGLPFIDLTDIQVDAALVPRVPTYLARQHSCAPVMIDDGAVLMATPHPLLPDVEEELRLRIGMPVRTLLCTSAQMNECIAKYYPKDAAVAEMAAKTAAPPKTAAPTAAAAAAAPGAATAPAPVASAPAPAATISPEAKKKARQIALVAFNFGFMLTLIAYYVIARKPTATTAIMYGILAGGVAALIGYLVGRKE